MQIILIFLIMWIGGCWLGTYLIDEITGSDFFIICFACVYLVGFFVGGVCFLCGLADDFSETKEYSVEISAIKDNLDINGEISGGMFYSSGYIETDLYYYYIVEETYGKKTYKTKASNTYIKETDETPKITYVKNVVNYPKWLDYWGWLETSATKYNILYVPYGTTTEQFEIDLE